jgi:ABC-type uncharacterized transport system substrate-binding protein
VDGQNIAIEYHWANGRNDLLEGLASDLVARKVDVLVATGGPDPVRAAKAATTTIPIVFTLGSDPVKLGVVSNLARPDGNLTGFTLSFSKACRCSIASTISLCALRAVSVETYLEFSGSSPAQCRIGGLKWSER